jgi:Zn-dependent peptidase ImmA (M78 family)
MGEMPTSPVTEGARQAASTRKQVGVPPTAPIDLAWLAERLKLVVVRRPMPTGLSGMHYAHPSGRSFVAINSAELSLRQNFTLAHEIGHHLFDGDQTIVEAVGESDGTPVEKRANAFAAHLLLPDEAISEWHSEVRKKFGLDDIAKLAIRYQLSYPATLYRLKSMHIVADVEPLFDKSEMNLTLRQILTAPANVHLEVPSSFMKLADEALERHIISKRRHTALLADLEREPE